MEPFGRNLSLLVLILKTFFLLFSLARVFTINKWLCTKLLSHVIWYLVVKTHTQIFNGELSLSISQQFFLKHAWHVIESWKPCGAHSIGVSFFFLSFFVSLFLLKFLFCVYFINYNAHQIIISHKPKSYSSKFGGSCPYISIFVMDMPISKSDFTCILKSLDFYFFN